MVTNLADTIKRLEALRADFASTAVWPEQKNHYETTLATLDAALAELRGREIVAWRWHWKGGDEPDVWAYTEYEPADKRHKIWEPLYAASKEPK